MCLRIVTRNLWNEQIGTNEAAKKGQIARDP